MRFLRTASTPRLLATIAGLAIAALAGTAIAVAAAGSGPVPPPKPLARAIHDALNAPQVQGITANISFTNHLIDASNLQGSDPLLSGATGRLWLSNDHRLRLELQSNSGDDAQVLVNNNSFWIYDPSSKTVYEGTIPGGSGQYKHPAGGTDRIPSIAWIESKLNQLMGHVNVSGAQPTDVARQPAYTVRVTPKHDGGLLGSAELGWDALHGVPLRFAIYAQNSSTPVIELKATNISYGAVPASDFAISPPSDAKVVKVATSAGNAADRSHGQRRHAEVRGVAAVAKRLPFPLTAPQKLVGLPRHSVTLLDWGGHPAALVAYGQNLGGVAVIEQSASSASAAPTKSTRSHDGGQSGLSRPAAATTTAGGRANSRPSASRAAGSAQRKRPARMALRMTTTRSAATPARRTRSAWPSETQTTRSA